MHLREIHVRNWRSYRNATFIFPTPNTCQKVILVGAQNGTGKTSLLIALYLGLFGREAMHLVEGVRLYSADADRSRTYKGLMEEIVHRPSLRQDEPHCSVQLRFETPESGSVLIQRRWNFNRGGRIRDAIARRIGAFSISDIERDRPGVSRDMMRLVLREMKAEGAIAPTGRGLSAKWSPQGEGPHHG